MRKSKLSETHPTVSSQWHNKLNCTLSPDQVVAGSYKKVWWQCPASEDHVYVARIRDKTYHNSGCPFCVNRKVCASNCLESTHPNIASEWHPSKNGTLSPRDIVAGTHKKAWWQCPADTTHVYYSNIYDRIYKQAGCPYCASKLVCKSNCLSTTHPKLALEWDCDKNKLTPEQVLYGSTKKFWWRCSSCNYCWKSTINNRSNGATGCPKCNESKGEKSIARYLEKHNIEFTRQRRFPTCKKKYCLPFDFSVVAKGVIHLIEYQGEQHYIPVRYSRKMDAKKELTVRQANDAIKEKWCADNVVELLVIPYWDFDKIEQKLTEFLNPLTS